ncbi:MAG: formylglycine-generating enzyme family protein [Desulfobacterales bacterium]
MRNSAFLSVLVLCVLLVCCRAAPAADNTFTNELGMEFVYIKPGTFMMGSPADEPDRNQSEKQHRATITEPFYMQATEVTIGQWQEVMGKKWLFSRKGPKDRPVTGVSWHDCRDFVQKLSKRLEGTYRLPTETQWEYACRAGTQTAYSWGDEIACTDAMFANSPVKSSRCVETVKNMGLEPGAPAPVKSYPPNAWGIHDMHGNVWEWCRNCFGTYNRPGENGNFSCSRRVRRGGSWYSNAHNLRSANRAWAHPASKFKTTGFRVIKEAP